MKVTINNSSLQRIKAVGSIAIPKSFPIRDGAILALPSGKHILSKKVSVGDLTDIYTFIGSFPPGEQIGEIVESSAKSRPSNYSNWVLANPASIFPRVIVDFGNEIANIPTKPLVGPLNANDHSMTFRLESHVYRGVRFLAYITVYKEVDYVEFKVAANWADQSNPSYNVTLNSVKLKFGCEPVLFFGQQMGVAPASYNPGTDTWSLSLLNAPHDIRDGQGIFDVKGYLFCNPEVLTNMTPSDEARIAELAKIRNGQNKFGGLGRINAVCHDMALTDWFNDYLPAKDNLTKRPYNETLFQSPNIYSERTVGIGKTPAQTGAQDDFGADRGFEATVFHDPLWIQYAMGLQTDRLRYYNIHEPNGNRVTVGNHPNRKTWGMETFDILSSDTLGKPKNVWKTDGNGWMGYDNQHRSINIPATYLALTGDEIVLDSFLNMIEQDFSQARNWDLADREIGRMNLAWSKLVRLLPQDKSQQLVSHIELKITELLSQWRGRFCTTPERTVKVSQVIRDNRTQMINPVTGKLETSWIPYQCAQMVSGLYSLWLLAKKLKKPDLATNIFTIMSACARTFLWHGTFKQNNVWWVCLFARYRTGLESGANLNVNTACPEDGIPLPQESYRLNNWEVYVDQESNGGWWVWAGPCISIAKLILQDQASKDRATEILNFAFPNGLRDQVTAEWFPLPLHP